jgi:hypothetical protein
MSIKDNLIKIKPFLSSKTFHALGLFLIVFSSFWLGKMSENREKRTPIILGSFETVKNSNILSQATSTDMVEVQVFDIFVASKNGKSYYLESCASAKKILPENKITFKSKTEAEKAGYKPAQNCKEMNLMK